MAKSREVAVDYDALTKDLVTNFFQSFIEFAIPPLYEATDWTIEPVFLEQELINMMKGKYKIKGKRKHPDKLARLRLLSGKDHYVLVHMEFQHRPEDDFGKRMFTYFILNFLRSDSQAFTAIAFFTGLPPDKSQLKYQTETFGTTLHYQFVSLIAAEQDETSLIESENPIALGILATLYAAKTENNPVKRLEYKKTLFKVAADKGFDREKLIKLLIFARDFVHLPSKLENEFLIIASEPFTTKEEIMHISQGTKKMAEVWYQQAYGFSPKKEMAKLKREADAREATAAREAAAREAAVREAADREAVVASEAAIFNLHKEFGLTDADIAKTFRCTEEYVQDVIKRLSQK